jgi:ABC-2 type transport system permease protein
MRQILANVRKDWFVLTSLVTKDFKLKYRRSILGVLWSVLNPLLMMLVLSAVFSFMLRFGDEISYFPLYLILGLIMFNYMSISTSSGMTSIIDAAPLIKKIRVNKTLFPVEKVVFELLNFAISLMAVAAVVVFTLLFPDARYGPLTLTPNVFLLPLLMAYVILFCAGLSLLLSSLAVFFRDVIHLWGVFILAWTYATPIFYPASLLEGVMAAAMRFNPMYHYVSYFRDIVLNARTPSVMENLVCLGMAGVTFVIGFFTFKALQKKFILYV